jgi:hypothetical protein
LLWNRPRLKKRKISFFFLFFFLFSFSLIQSLFTVTLSRPPPHKSIPHRP